MPGTVLLLWQKTTETILPWRRSLFPAVNSSAGSWCMSFLPVSRRSGIMVSSPTVTERKSLRSFSVSRGTSVFTPCWPAFLWIRFFISYGASMCMYATTVGAWACVLSANLMSLRTEPHNWTWLAASSQEACLPYTKIPVYCIFISSWTQTAAIRDAFAESPDDTIPIYRP